MRAMRVMLTIPAFTVLTATLPGSVTPSWRTARMTMMPKARLARASKVS